MARYRVLKSIAHNSAHSLLADSWWVDGAYFYEHLYDAARAADSPVVEIDPLAGTIIPSTLATGAVRHTLEHLPKAFREWVVTGGAAESMVQTARIRIEYDFIKSPPDPMSVPGRRRLYYTCTSEIVDDRGRTHRASVVPHWAY